MIKLSIVFIAKFEADLFKIRKPYFIFILRQFSTINNCLFENIFNKGRAEGNEFFINGLYELDKLFQGHELVYFINCLI